MPIWTEFGLRQINMRALFSLEWDEGVNTREIQNLRPAPDTRTPSTLDAMSSTARLQQREFGARHLDAMATHKLMQIKTPLQRCDINRC